MKVVILIGFVVFLNLFFFHAIGSTAFFIFILGSLLSLLVIFKDNIRNKNPLIILGISVSVILLPILLVFRSAFFVTILNVLSTLFLINLLIYYLTIVNSNISSLFELLMTPMMLGINYLKSALLIGSNLLTQKYNNYFKNIRFLNKKLIKTILIVGFVVIPLILILLSILTSADPVFNFFLKKINITFINNLISTDLFQEVLSRTELSVFLFLLFLPIILLNIKKISSPIVHLERFNLIRETTILMFLVGLVIAIFIVVEWPYIFAKVTFETSMSRFGVVTYSEYVKKGFVELLKASSFIYLLLWSGLLMLRSNSSKKKPLLFYLQMIVFGEFLIFIFSIFRRIWLYQEYHGWSLMRIYGGFFLIWIAGITLTLALRHLKKFNWYVVEIIFTFLIICFIGLFNAEKFIVLYNPPTVNRRIDYIYLSRMSADGFQGWLESYNYAKNILTINYDLKPIDKEQRREIAYAGSIINRLLYKTNNLMLEYGLSVEIREYYKNVLFYLTEDNANSMIRYQNKLKKDDNDKEDFNNLTKERSILNDLIIKINKKDEKLSQFTYWINVFNTNEPVEFFPNSSAFSSISLNSYLYDSPQSKPTVKDLKNQQRMTFGFLSRLFIWNNSRFQAFQGMKKQIKYQELLLLNNKYKDLYEKISKLPDNERKYDHDVSFDSPLLGDL